MGAPVRMLSAGRGLPATRPSPTLPADTTLSIQTHYCSYCSGLTSLAKNGIKKSHVISFLNTHAAAAFFTPSHSLFRTSWLHILAPAPPPSHPTLA